MGSGKNEAISISHGLLREGRSGTLSTTLPKHEGWPYGSLVTFATDHDGSPLFLFSNLSDHARNLQADNRASLLIERTSNRIKPQTGPRVTLLGTIEKTTQKRHQKRFIARHPQSAMYAGFADFNFYRMSLERVHYVGGFAKATWFRGRELLTNAKTAKTIGDAEEDIISHMNEDHADTIDRYANALLHRKGTGWRMSAIDCDGADLMLNERIARLKFNTPVSSTTEVRAELVRLSSLASESVLNP
jgi:putative heme iron utilization protein